MYVQLKNIVCGYKGDIMILNGITMSLEKSKVTGIIGPNGAGKSTILKTIYGYLKPKSGSIILEGKDITGIAPNLSPREGLVFIPQHRSVFPELTVKENMEMGAWIYRKDRKRVRESIEKIYERFPILKKREKVLGLKLSGGEQRMLEFGRALMVKPKVMLVDEPTAGLAPIIAEQIYQKLKEITEEERVTTLLVDQNMKKAVALSDYLYVVNEGRIVNEGSRGSFNKQLETLISEWLL